MAPMKQQQPSAAAPAVENKQVDQPAQQPAQAEAAASTTATNIGALDTDIRPSFKPGSADYALAQIMRELSSVAAGAPVARLRSVVAEHTPKNTDERMRFLDLTRRLRGAAEVIDQQAVIETAGR